jgi:uncharacterized protein (TIGR03663 family)
MSSAAPAPSREGAGLYSVLIAAIALGALAVRVPQLDRRPMHTDEAVHAQKFADLLEAGEYEYNPHEYHGPTLNYFTLVPAWLQRAGTYERVTELTLRIVPVVFGVLLVLASALLVRGLGRGGAAAAAVLAAVSPAFVFYSRYYIQETLLVFFTFAAIACGYRYVRVKSVYWARSAGAAVGLMHATKETCIIAFAAMACALAGVLTVSVVWGKRPKELLAGFRPAHLVVALVTAILVSALFCSSFLTHPRGVLDSYLTYATYFGRAGGEQTVHVHPWHYYLGMLLFWKYADGPLWTEALILVLALVGAGTLLRRPNESGVDRSLVGFLVLYTAAMTVVYSAIPYKTPWCMLGFLHGMILLAGVGATAVVRWLRPRGRRIAAVIVLVVAVLHLLLQAVLANFVYPADSRNPYVYGHTTDEIFTVAEQVRQYAGACDDPCDLTVQVACTGHDYWPLPWYLRFYRAGHSDRLPEKIGPLIFVSEDLEGALTRKLYAQTPSEERQMYLYVFEKPYYVWLRPQVKLFGFVRKDLWDRYVQQPDPDVLIRGSHEPEREATGDDVRPE